MEKLQQYKINISAPNLLNVCVDRKEEGKISGRLYHCYKKEAIVFCDVVELIREAEKLFDAIGFPQASTVTRSFVEAKNVAEAGNITGTAGGKEGHKAKPEKVLTQQEIICNRGKKGTFVVHVRFRQSSTWQGDVCRMETEEVRRFSNTLDFIKIIDAEIEEE